MPTATLPDTTGSAPLKNAKRERFVQEYRVDLNITQAAIRAGYSPRSAHVTGHRLLNDAKVGARLAHFQQETAQTTDITIERVLQELAVVGFSSVEHLTVNDAGEVVPADQAPANAVRSVASVKHTIRSDSDGYTTRTVEVRYWPKVQALELIGKHLGAFPNKVELTGKDGEPLIPPGRMEPDAAAERLRAILALRN